MANADPVRRARLDDRSRLACHLQWYHSEAAENIAHGLSQAMHKRGLPRAAMSDNGAAMTATEITEGLARRRRSHPDAAQRGDAGLGGAGL
jgi:putative transposase